MITKKPNKADREVSKESDANDLNDTAPYGQASVQTSDADYARNKDGLYGGVPKARDPAAPGDPPASKPHPRR
jgi:hypothetical protein